MNRSAVAGGCAVTLVIGLTWCAFGDTAPPEKPYIKVEIRGQLLPGTEGEGGRPGPARVKLEGMTIELEFKGHAAPPPEIRRLYHQTVTIRGTLKQQGGDRLICVVEGDVQGDPPAGRDAQYLVGYRDGQQATVESLCRKLGIKVVDRYGPGKYLVVEPAADADEDFVEKLKESRAVRYVEKNKEYRVPEKKAGGLR
jgi:hypothetical protein